MPGSGRRFLDSNILLYTVAGPDEKFRTAQKIVTEGGVISVQVLNEFTTVSRRKFKLSWRETRDLLGKIEKLLEIVPLTTQTHATALNFAERYNLAFYDAVIAAAAHLANCTILYSEDMHDGLQITPGLRLQNPFT
jgi:predicted nucleic acid-binding protein